MEPEFQYRNFQYFTGISVGLREHFDRLVSGLAEEGEIQEGKFVFDIGSNDGSLLERARKFGARILGIDPAERIANSATENGIPTIADFFSRSKADEIVSEHGKADVIISNNTVANIDNLDDFFEGVRTCLADDGLVVIETQYALDVVEKFLLDVIYHEHVTYFSAQPMQMFAERMGLELIDAQRIAPKGGSIRFILQPKGAPRRPHKRVAELISQEHEAGIYREDTFQTFNQRISDTSRALKEILSETRQKNGRALGSRPFNVSA